MKNLKYFIFCFYLFTNYSNANNLVCLEATQFYENKYELPNKLLLSVALTESGRTLDTGEFVSWPWTVNYKGRGKFFKSKEAATDFVKNYTKNGKRNIDIGCMQINYMYHPNAFKNIEDAFDPQLNVEWSAKLIKSLYERFGSWKKAVGYYHSYRTSKRTKYSAKVFNTWLDIKKDNKYADIKFDNLLSTAIIENYSPPKKEVKNNTKHTNNKNLDTTYKKKKGMDKRDLNNSPYIMARMEKVKFFRAYFLKTK